MSNFQLHSSIKFIQGAIYSLLIDTQKGRIYRLNDNFTKIIQFLIEKSMDEINKHPLRENILTFLQDLIELELGDFVANRINYENLQFQDYSLGDIENAIVEFEINNYYLMKDVLHQLIGNGCKFIEIRFLDEISIELLNELLVSFNASIVSGITLMFRFGRSYGNSDLVKLMDNHYRVHEIFVFNSQEAEMINAKGGNICFLTNDLDYKLCGAVREELFANLFHINTSKKFNSCLYKKVFISKEGNVKNCPSLQFSFGNIFNESLQYILDNTDLKKLWFVKKDMIYVCKDCEFRHICTDCRAYIEHPEDILSKPLKCGYNPYTGEWNEWSTNPLKQNVIEYYGMEKIVRDRRNRIESRQSTNEI